MSTLAVLVESARNLPPKSGSLDKIDPYVVCQIGATAKSTSFKKNGGSNVTFAETLSLPYADEPELIVHVKDKDRIGKDDCLGTGKFTITSYVKNHGFQGCVKLLNPKGQEAGEVHLKLHFA
eukprot:Gregarina_sp_Poly_1__4648@NODE_2485_length_2067_cov_219_457000_g1577_i0_p3_GENE_NODE_2485_length_2067_cov_219_457000_g1577_i0NODE_2485_length_2067_cov_219_457000_g1577_i0_p3_ORF_typecomplete_len122_score22_31C2/PF00168_30/2_9e16_NODE_2485_length_2067_cov_219_457000_g1577_i016512016